MRWISALIFLKDAPQGLCFQTIEVRALGCPIFHSTNGPRSLAPVNAVALP